MIIITGPGRSGTSVLAQFCLKMGYNPGGSWYDCVDAGLEHPRVAAINDALYHEATRTGAVTHTLEQYREEMGALDLAVVKDPRFTFHPAILRAWHSVRTDLKVLMTYRTPEHALASRKRHARNLLHKDKAHPDVLRCDFANAIEGMLDQEITFTLLLFPHFLAQYQSVYEAFKVLGMAFEWEEGRTVWNRLVNMEKVHFQPAAKSLRREAEPGSGCDTLWQRLARISMTPIGKAPAIAVSLLILLGCVPFEWKTLEASATQSDAGSQGVAGLRHRAFSAPLTFVPSPFRNGTAHVRFNSAFLTGLSLYSVQRFPFDTLYPGPAFHRRSVKLPGKPSG